MIRPTEQPWWVDAHDRPDYFTDLCHALVEGDVCDWRAAGKPHPQEPALIALAFFRDRGLLNPASTGDNPR